jgi:hypothetical protein
VGSQLALAGCFRSVLLRTVTQHATAARTVGTDSALIASIRAEWRECRGWGGPGACSVEPAPPMPESTPGSRRRTLAACNSHVKRAAENAGRLDLDYGSLEQKLPFRFASASTAVRLLAGRVCRFVSAFFIQVVDATMKELEQSAQELQKSSLCQVPRFKNLDGIRLIEAKIVFSWARIPIS